MTQSSWDRVWTTFHRAAALAVDERQAFLDRACETEELRAEVEELLAAAEVGSGVLEGDAPLRSLLSELEVDVAESGDRIGPYRLVRRIGAGGMGVVYEAEQKAPLERRVALKLIKLGMDTREVVARFEAERQALALMGHPGIARVFDAGATESGKPYFDREYVDGVPIDEYCDRERLSLDERLRLFVRVCDAVQHAHRKGIIHRDLKPGNVLVTPEGEPRIIDFGVAKAVDRPLTERTLATALGRVVGTPEYMSPEQAALAPDVDTRADVYALGVVLYELLTGMLPFDFEGKSYTEIQRLITETEPPRPSTRIDDLSDRADELARRRGTDPSSWRRRLKGDLDWILVTALATEREERYGAVAELAADVERYLDRQPVLAGPPSRLYRARKFVRRHAVGVAAVAAVLAVVVVAVVLLVAESRRLAAALERESAERAKAEQVTRFLIDLFEAPDPYLARGESVSARDVLERGIDRIAGELDEQALVKAELLSTMGKVAQRLGEYETARELHEHALELRHQELGEGSREVAASLHDLGVALSTAGDHTGAVRRLRRAVAIRGGTLGVDHPEVADSTLQLGVALQARGDHDSAAERFEEALDTAERIGDESLVAEILMRRASLARQTGDLEAAARDARRALRLRSRALGDDHPSLIAVRGVLGHVLHRAGDYEAAEATYRDNLAAQQRLFGPDHPDVGGTLNSLGALLYDRGDDSASEAVLRRSIELWRVHGESGRVRLSTALNNLALVHQRQGEHEEAERLYREALEIDREVYGEASWKVASDLNNLGWLYHETGELDRAESHYRRALTLHREIFGPEHPSTAFQLNNLAQLSYQRGELETAERLARAALRIRRAALPPDHPQVASSESTLGTALTALGRTGEAEPLLRRALLTREATFGADDWHTAETMSALGECVAAQGRIEEARTLLESGYERLLAAKGPDDRRTERARRRLQSVG